MNKRLAGVNLILVYSCLLYLIAGRWGDSSAVCCSTQTACFLDLRILLGTDQKQANVEVHPATVQIAPILSSTRRASRICILSVPFWAPLNTQN